VRTSVLQHFYSPQSGEFLCKTTQIIGLFIYICDHRTYRPKAKNGAAMDRLGKESRPPISVTPFVLKSLARNHDETTTSRRSGDAGLEYGIDAGANRNSGQDDDEKGREEEGRDSA
jgi:hypothetical protein